MSSSFFENYPSLMSAGPGPGTPTVVELYAGSILIIPLSYYGLSGFDGQWIRTANSYLTSKYGGGEIRLMAGQYNMSSSAAIDEANSLIGIPGASIINWSGTGTCISHHGSNDSFNPTFKTVGAIRGITIDGTNAGANSVGLDVGDGWGHDVDVVIRNFSNGANAIGLWLNNNNVWSEKCRFRASVMNCSNHVVFDVTGPGLISHMYSEYEFYIYALGGQNGVVVQNGAEPSRCFFKVRGNMKTTTGTAGAALRFTGTNSHAVQCLWQLGMECNGTDVNAPQTLVLAATGNTFTQMHGILAFLNVGGNTPWAAATLGDNFNFEGTIIGDSALSNPAQPTLPASGTVFTNKSQPGTVYVWGGTVTQISISGQATGLTSGSFKQRFNDTIKITYSVAPSWLWIWETQ